MSRLTPWLSAVLVLSVALFMGFFWGKPQRQDFYLARVQEHLLPSPSPSRFSEPPSVPLASPPPDATRFAHAKWNTVEPAFRYRGEHGPAFEAWRKSLKKAVSARLDYEPGSFDGNVRFTAKTEFPTFTRHKLYLHSIEDLWIPAYLLVPKGITQPRPAVIGVPGHDWQQWKGAAAIAGLDEPGNPESAFGLHLAKAGYVVLAMDVAGVGEMGYLSYGRLVRQGLLANHPLRTLMLEEIHQATDYLLTRPEVDPKRLGVMGISMGGELSLFSAALDSRFSWAVSSGLLSSYRDFREETMLSLYVPGMLEVADIPDIAGAIAPRPLLIQVGMRDPVLPMDKFASTFNKVQRAYVGSGHGKALSLTMHPDGHYMVIPPVLDWVKRNVPL